MVDWEMNTDTTRMKLRKSDGWEGTFGHRKFRGIFPA
jgi:hypothetical protein